MAGKFNLTELLNQRSKEKEAEQEAGKQEEKMEIEYVDVYDLIPSKENFYHVDERLKKNIEIMGLLQPILVKRPVGGKYEVIAGHRRRLALIALVEEGKEKFRQVPCVFKQEKRRGQAGAYHGKRFQRQDRLGKDDRNRRDGTPGSGTEKKKTRSKETRGKCWQRLRE